VSSVNVPNVVFLDVGKSDVYSKCRREIVNHVLKCVISNVQQSRLCSEIYVRHESWVGRGGNVF